MTSVPSDAVTDVRGSRGRYRWLAHVFVNVAVGWVAAVGWPFVYFMGYAVATQAGWVVGDPTVTDDGVSLTIAFGVVATAVIVGLFVGLNICVGRWTRVRPAHWVPAGVAVASIMTVVAARVMWHH